jgi:hypothetical protein
MYPPDPAAVGQHMADAAVALVNRGRNVRVLTANSGYEDPSVRYPARETRDNVEIRRLPLSSLGKATIAHRLLAAFFFTPKLKAVVVSTMPPMAATAAIIIGSLRRVPVTYWVMDISPDIAVVAGKFSPNAPAVRLFDFVNKIVLGRASAVIVLDRFMKERILAKKNIPDKLSVIPPWPLQKHIEPVDHADNPFRKKHGLAGKFVIMFSGNLSLVSPVTTILHAALALKDDHALEFVFIGGGYGKREIEEFIKKHHIANILSLPYQPLDELKFSISAADVHLVTMGENMVGIIHPCKIYGAMAAARPILYLGPSPSHISEILDAHPIGWSVRHGDLKEAVETIRRIMSTPSSRLHEMGKTARQLIEDNFSKASLCDTFCDAVDRTTSSLPAA